jgi:4-hydroxybenzoate polyprenyltransferase
VKTTLLQNPAGISRIKLFLALSRTPHGMLDLAAPGLSALLWVGGFPPAGIMGLGLLTAFCGYTSVYALNDVTDHRVDGEKGRGISVPGTHQDLDSVFVEHPLARGMLTFREGLFWALAWAALAAVGAYLLNPVCACIFLVACLLEFIYCRLLKVTYLRGVISGLVKTSGPVAAVFAVDPSPAPSLLGVLFLWFFFWEIGGQNVPNDFADVEEDRRIGGRTIPVRFGLQGSSRIILGALFLAVGMSLIFYLAFPGGMSPVFLVGAFFCGVYFLLEPAVRLYKKKTPGAAFALFNRASYYPLAMAGVTMASWIL